MRRIIFTLCLAVTACAPLASDSQSPVAGPGEEETVEASVAATARQPAAPPTNTAAPSVAESGATIEPGATVRPEDTAVPATARPTSTSSPSPTPPASPTAGVVSNGRTADGAYFLGRSHAPVTIIDYSDFL